MKTNWAITLALLAVLVLSTVSPAFAAAKLRVGKLTIGSQAGTLTYGSGGSVTYSVVVTAATGQGSGIITLKITGLPAGVNGVYDNSTLSLTGGQSKSAVLTLTSNGTPAAGTFSFTVEADGTNIKTVLGSLLIGKKSATVTANNLSKEYGTDYSFAGSEFTASGFISGDNVTSVTLSSPLGAPASATVAGSPYPIVPSAAVGSGLANYNIQYAAGNMTVTRAPLSVTLVAGIDRVYDGLTTAAVDASKASLSGVIGLDVVNLNIGAATGTFLSPNVGAETIQVAGLTISGASAGNYSLVQPTTTANITPATATVTPNLAFMVSDGADPTFTVSYSGFVNGETSSVVTTAPECSVPVPHTVQGNYDIVCSGAAAQNYIFDYVNVNGALYVSASNALPTNITLSNNSVAERLAAGAIVGDLTTTDADSTLGETYSYTLSTSGLCAGLGADNGSFSIPSGFSAIPVPLKTAASLHYVTKSSYNICVVVDDGFGGTLGKAFVVNVLPSQLVINSSDVFDGYILQSAPGSTVGGSMNSTASTLMVGDDRLNRQYRSILSFRTGGLLPANPTILGVTIKIKKVTLTNPNLFSNLLGLRVDVIKPYYGNSGALQLTDFTAPTPLGAGLVNACGFDPTPDSNGWYSTYPKCSQVLPAYINKVGPTQFRLRFTSASNMNGVADSLSFYSGNATPVNEPQLILTYSVP